MAQTPKILFNTIIVLRGLEAGDKVRYIVENGRVHMLKARHVRDLAGMLRRPGQSTVSLEEMDEAIAEGAVESAS